jgi:hypothetical protein
MVLVSRRGLARGWRWQEGPPGNSNAVHEVAVGGSSGCDGSKSWLPTVDLGRNRSPR